MLPANKFQIQNLFGKGKSGEPDVRIEHKLEGIIKILFFGFVTITAICGIFIYFIIPDGAQLISIRVFIGTLNLSILSGLCAVYFFARKLYEDHFYFLIGLNWLLIAIQIICQMITFINDKSAAGYPSILYLVEHRQILYLTISILSVFSNMSLLLATIIPQNFSLKNSETIKLFLPPAIKSFLKWIFLTLVLFLIMINFESYGMAFLIAQTPLSVWVFVMIGLEIKKKLESEVFSEAINYLSFSFILFAVLQILFLVNLWLLENPYLAPVLAAFSLFIKFLSLMSFFIILSDKYNEAIVLEGAGRSSLNLEHEIKTPLVWVSDELYNIKNNTSAADREKSIEIIERHINKINDSLKLILFLRKDNLDLNGLIKKVKIGDIINAAVKDVKEIKEKPARKVTFSVSIPKEIEAALYPYGIQEAISNVLVNSVEAISEANLPNGRIEIEAKLAESNPQMIKITILDNGPGIPSRDIRKVLSTVNYSTKKEGKSDKRNGKSNRGNGISMTRRIIEKHGGEINIDSESEEGSYTKIKILLPTGI